LLRAYGPRNDMRARRDYFASLAKTAWRTGCPGAKKWFRWQAKKRVIHFTRS